MARLRYNGLTTTLGSSLTSSATSVTFAAALTHSGGTNVPTITGSDYIPLTILDSAGKVSEIVYLTAYTTAGTTGTITRGQEGTTGAAHSSGDKVVHAPTVLDISPAMTEVTKSADQSLPSAVYTTLTWATEVVDDLGAFDSATSTTRLVAPTAGLYQVSCRVAFEGGLVNTARAINIKKNGTDLLGREAGYAAATFVDYSITRTLMLAAGDYLEAQVYGESDSNYVAKALRFGNSASIFTLVRLG